MLRCLLFVRVTSQPMFLICHPKGCWDHPVLFVWVFPSKTILSLKNLNNCETESKRNQHQAKFKIKVNPDFWPRWRRRCTHCASSYTQKKDNDNLKTKNNQNWQNIELYGSPTTKEIKKTHSSRPVGWVETSNLAEGSHGKAVLADPMRRWIVGWGSQGCSWQT